VKTYTNLLSNIYGFATGEIVSQGVQNPRSILLPSSEEVWTEDEVAWSVLEIIFGVMFTLMTVRAFFISSLSLLPAKFSLPVAYSSSTLFGETLTKLSMVSTLAKMAKNIGKAVSEVLITLGKGTDPEPSSFTDEEIQRYLKGSTFMGSTSRARANRSKAISWRPTRTIEHLLASVLSDTKVLFDNAYYFLD